MSVRQLPHVARSLRDALEDAASRWARMGWYLTSSRDVRLRTIVELHALRLLEFVGAVTICDGDGWAKEPERFRDGYGVTSEGWALVDAMADHARRAEAA